MGTRGFLLPGAPGDGVVLINGKQVLRVPAGESPYQVREFEADVTAYAGQYVLMEVLSDNGVRGAAAVGGAFAYARHIEPGWLRVSRIDVPLRSRKLEFPLRVAHRVETVSYNEHQ